MSKLNQSKELISFYTFYMKEVRRFLKVWGQTILGPIITTTLFLLVFGVVFSNSNVASNRFPEGVSFQQFLIPGLAMMAIIQNAFSNTSSSILIAKVSNSFNDVLMAPIRYNYVIVAYNLAAITRGLMIGAVIVLYSLFFVSFNIESFFWMFYYSVMAASALGLLGIIAGIVCTKFDQLANITNLFIVPMSFLSGTFYSVKMLPEKIQHIIAYNPFFYMIDGFRYAFIGVIDFNIIVGAFVLLIVNVVLYLLTVMLWNKGYNIKS